jgi:hypothetical protein
LWCIRTGEILQYFKASPSVLIETQAVQFLLARRTEK